MSVSIKVISCFLLLSILRFDYAQSKEFELTVNINASSAPNLADWVPKLRSAIETYYLKTSEYLGYPGYTPPSVINITLDASCDGHILSSNNAYTVCAKSLEENGPTQKDLNAIVQTTTWSVMSYPSPPQAPNWLTQCLAAYCRWYRFQPTTTNTDSEKNEGPSKPDSDTTSPKTAGSNGCAYFVNYVNTVYTQTPDVVQKLNKQMRTGKYKDTDWKDITGKSGKELWAEMLSQGSSDGF